MPFSLLTANVCNGAADPVALAELVDRVDADVVALQELSEEQAEAVARLRPHGRLEPRDDHHGMGIALRYPGAVRHLSLPVRPARAARLEKQRWPGLDASVEIVNVHVSAPHIRPVWRTLRQRAGQLRALESHLEALERPCVVVGDFNATPLWPVYRRLARHLEDGAVLASRARGDRVQPTWGPRAGAPRVLRIDHVMVDQVRVEHLEVLPLPGSDHSAVLAHLVPEK